MLAKYYEGWNPDVIERLTPRQARGWYNRIPEVQKMFTGGESEGGSGEQDWDLDKIFEEAEDLGLKPPRG